MSPTKKARIVLTFGLFMILPIVVFRSILYVGFTSDNTDIETVSADVENVIPDDKVLRWENTSRPRISIW